jgi:large repetitive protein
MRDSELSGSATVHLRCYAVGTYCNSGPRCATGLAVDQFAGSPGLTKAAEKVQSMPFLSSTRSAEEFRFVSTFFRCTGLATRTFALPLALLGLAGLFAPASAQTAPQLLPYTTKLIAGGATTSPAKGATCPVSGNISTDAFGDGCLATEVNLGGTSTGGPRYAVADKNGNVFFGDFVNGLVRRVDALTGVITTVAGGATSSPAAGTACGTGVSTDADGDGCPANLVKLSKPDGVAFDAAGNLYFSDNGFDDVRKIAATGGLITTTGIITNVIGGSTFGYNVNNTSTTGPVIAATAGLSNFPAGIAFDAAGNLYLADEGNNALEVVNLTAATETIQGMSVPAGTVVKFDGFGSLNTKNATSGDCPDFTAAVTGSRGGCYFGKWTDGAVANVSNNDGVYSVAVDATNGVYYANEFNNDVGYITAANIVSNFAGVQASAAKAPKTRAVAGSFGIGSVFGVALDTLNNLYITDASSGVIWRVDGAGKSMYVVGGGATTVCAGATDTFGDGCAGPFTAIYGSSGAGSFATTTLPGPGIYGVSVDAFSDLFFGDTETMLVRELASGTQFGAVGANQPTQIVDIHFAAADSAASSGAYTLTAGASNFILGTASCTTNTDNTTDCTLPITANPTTLGAFSGVLTVKSTLGATANFPLNGTFVTSRFTHTTVAVNTGSAACSSSTVSTTAPITFTAAVFSTGVPTGTITFFANGTQIGTPQNVNSAGVATLTNTFSTAGSYKITATYSGDANFNASTSSGTTIVSSPPTFTTAVTTISGTINASCPGLAGMVGQCTVSAGQTALYSFNVTQNVFTGTITFSCSGLPAGASCSFSPQSITATGCSTVNTVALSISTQQALPVAGSALGVSGSGRWQAFGILPGVLLALWVGIRRRRSPLRFGGALMALALLLATSGLVACGKGGPTSLATPSGTSTVTVTATGSTGTTASFTVPLIVK